ncbi:MAG: hypothetical protein M1497_13080 [Nitrospirae bacterium]|nr:hypothetical protein [Nitrospirota bacterium]
MRSFRIIFALLSFASSTAFATSIVAVMNNDEIVIGADSKTTLIQAGRGKGDPENITKCKIVQAGNLFFASAGSAGIGPAGAVDPEFDIRETIARGLLTGGGIDEKVGNLEKALVAGLTRIAEEARQDNAAFFLKSFVGQPVHTVIIGGLDNGELVLRVRTFSLIISPSGSLSFEIGRFACPGDCGTSFLTVFEGQTEAIRNYLQDHYFADPVTAVRDLVELEISKDPSSVGPPVDILRLTRKGVKWVQRKPLCPDIQTIPILLEGEAGANNP